jgi:enamine deaminase RidA (YjgF/YER057c/UK114 family)
MTRREDREKITALREELFSQWFPDGDHPISTLLFISGLYREEFLIEIEAIAVR